MYRKSTWLLIILLFIAVVSAACGRSSGSPASVPAETIPTNTVSTPEPTATPEPEPVSIDLIGTDGVRLTVYEYDTDVTLTDIGHISGLIENASTLPALQSISLSDGMEFTLQDVSAIQEAYPEAKITYNVIIDGKEIPLDSTSLDFSALPTECISEAVRELKKLPDLQKVNLTPAISVTGNAEKVAESKNGAVFNDNLTIEQVGTLVASRPDITFDYKFLLYGKTVSTADERLEYIDIKIYDEGVESVIRPIMPAMNRLNYLKLDKCEVSSPIMAKLRDDFPDVKVVWRVYFSAYGQTGDGSYAVYNCLTDTEKIWATGCVTDQFATELQYCTDVKYLDLGHNCITNVDFVRYMPNLEVAILSISWLRSLEPLASCPKLEYLECFSTEIEDLSPLAACTNLKHLNTGSPRAEHPFTDLSPLYGLNLERLYCTTSKIPLSQQEEFIALHPDCECEFGAVDPTRGYWKFLDGNYMNTDPSNRNDTYARIYEIFGYDNPSKNQSK